VTWLHDASQTALAAAVTTLGLVILLELRSIARLRRALDCNLARVFEQLDLLRFEIQQLIEAQTYGGAVRLTRTTSSSLSAASTHPGAANPTTAVTDAATGADSGAATRSPAALPAGEARLLATLAAARANRGTTKAA
jgi:hypothetical protein